MSCGTVSLCLYTDTYLYMYFTSLHVYNIDLSLGPDDRGGPNGFVLLYMLSSSTVIKKFSKHKTEYEDCNKKLFNL
jgi:hypothetical protein